MLRVFTSQRIAYGISHTIMYVGSAQLHAAMSLRWLKKQILYNKLWANTFGLRPGDKWTDEYLEIHHGVDQYPITVLAMGITGQIRGFNPDDFRPDLIIVDDVLTDENTATIEQREKIEELLFGALFNSLAPASEQPLAKIAFCQTPFHKEDAIEACMEDPQWNGLSVSCFDDKGHSAWPDRWSTDTLVAEKTAATRRGQYSLWMREMECQLVASEYKAIDVTKLRYWDVLPEQMGVIVSIDPASSEAKTADDFAMVALGFLGADVYVLDVFAERGVLPDAAVNRLFELILRWSPIRVVVESISFQRVLAWYIEQEMQKRRIFVAVDQIQDRRKKSDRIMQAIPGLVAFGHLVMHPSQSKAIKQMDDYDPTIKDQKDDIVDAIALGIMSVNPELRGSVTLEGEFTTLPDSDTKRQIEFRGCP
jgi:hypothetical protein